jgi:carboxyl-terminal processing protease
MSSRLKYTLGSLLAVVALIFSFGLGHFAALLAPPDGDELDRVIEAWATLTGEYVEPGSIDKNALAEAAINGMMDYLGDPYSAYLDSAAYRATMDDFAGTYTGIGAEMAIREETLVVLTVYPDTPAESSGLTPGDIITGVDGTATAGLNMTELGLLVRGDAGTPVTLTVDRNDNTLSLTMTRAVITPPSVRFEMRGDIAYVSISSFNEHTDEEMGPVIRDINSSGAVGIILDLRYNPGGLVTTVVNTASHFLPAGEVLFTVRDNDGKEVVHKTVARSATTDLPMVVLVNQYSASGSEVLSGALQDHERAVVAGHQTFGKGSVNQLFQLSGGTGIYLTIARWYTPDGHLIEGVGITPDHVLTLQGDDLVTWAADYLKIA